MESRRTAVRVLHVVARLAIAGVLLWSGVAKAADRQTSILAVDAYDVLPEALVTPVATILPWAEIGLGVLLVIGLFLRPAALATSALTVAFLAGMAQAKARGLKIDCGCFGGGGPGEGVTWLDIGRDAVILAAAAWLAWRPRGPLQIDSYFAQEEGDGREGQEAAVEG